MESKIKKTHKIWLLNIEECNDNICVVVVVAVVMMMVKSIMQKNILLILDPIVQFLAHRVRSPWKEPMKEFRKLGLG